MADLAGQRRFAVLFNRAMEVGGYTGVWLEKQTGISQTTLSKNRYGDPAYRSGPPRHHIRRTLEKVMGLKVGYLDGLAEMSDSEILEAGDRARRETIGESPASGTATPESGKGIAEQSGAPYIVPSPLTIPADPGHRRAVDHVWAEAKADLATRRRDGAPLDFDVVEFFYDQMLRASRDDRARAQTRTNNHDRTSHGR